MSSLKLGVVGLIVFILVVLFLGMLMKSTRGFEGFQEGLGGKGEQCSPGKKCNRGLTCNNNNTCTATAF